MEIKGLDELGLANILYKTVLIFGTYEGASIQYDTVLYGDVIFNGAVIADDRLLDGDSFSKVGVVADKTVGRNGGSSGENGRIAENFIESRREVGDVVRFEPLGQLGLVKESIGVKMLANVVRVGEIVALRSVDAVGQFSVLQGVSHNFLIEDIRGEHGLNEIIHAGVVLDFLEGIEDIDAADVDVAVSEVPPKLHVHLLQLDAVCIEFELVSVIMVDLQDLAGFAVGDVDILVHSALPHHRRHCHAF